MAGNWFPDNPGSHVVWSAATGQLQSSTPSHDGEISHVEFSPDGEHLVALFGNASPG
jgi:WD40 repeat protein